ncbi:MAG TPA: glucosyl-3-phosphoglycerate synthase [Acidimicrobiales bacterium]|nr:glucosyl-3-phosphoglycerate synthase [Acidimicrobiales bacterium]
MTGGPRTFDGSAFDADDLVAAKAGRSVTVCIPARDEERTVGAVVGAVRRAHCLDAGGSGLVDEVVVVDDRSVDGTAAAAGDAGARVLAVRDGGGKGGAMAAGVEGSVGDLVVFLDADVENTTAGFVTGLLGPLLTEDDVALVKGFYRRPLGGQASGGGRVTELMARPLIEVLFPALVDVRQPLAGETAAPRWVLEKLQLAPDYGVELGMLVDVAARFGAGSIAQVDLGVRVHRNRSLDELRPQAVQVLRAALDRSGRR